MNPMNITPSVFSTFCEAELIWPAITYTAQALSAQVTNLKGRVRVVAKGLVDNLRGRYKLAGYTQATA